MGGLLGRGVGGVKGYVGPPSQIIGGPGPPAPPPPASSYAYDYGNKPVNLKIIIKKKTVGRRFFVFCFNHPTTVYSVGIQVTVCTESFH